MRPKMDPKWTENEVEVASATASQHPVSMGTNGGGGGGGKNDVEVAIHAGFRRARRRRLERAVRHAA